MNLFRAVVALTLVVVVPLILRLGIYDDSARRSKSGGDANTPYIETDCHPLPSLLYRTYYLLAGKVHNTIAPIMSSYIFESP
jgi:hypothetical protein